MKEKATYGNQHTGKMRWGRAVVCAVAGCLAFGLSADVGTEALIPIVGWAGLPQGKASAERYAEAKDAGFTHLTQWCETPSDAGRLLAEAEKAGVKLIIGFGGRDIKRMTDEAEAFTAVVKGVAFVPGMASDVPTAKKIVAGDNAAGDVKGYLVIQLNNWVSCISPIARTFKPLLFCSFPYSGIGGWDVDNSTLIERKWPKYAFMSSLDFNDTIGAACAFEKLKDGTADDFVKAATDYRLSHTPPESGVKPVEGPLDCLTPEETLAAVKGKKILSVEGCPAKFKAQILKDFGIVVEDLKFAELNAAWEKIPDAVAQPKVDEWKRAARKIGGVTDATLLGCAKMFFAMKQVLKDRGAMSITINCLGGCYTGDFEKAYLQWNKFGWHRVTFLGDFKKGVEAFAKKIGYKVVYES